MDHREQEERCHKLEMGKWWERSSSPGPPSAHFPLHPFPRWPGHAPVSKGLSDFQWDRVCSVLPSPFCLTSLICGIRPRLPAPGLFLLLSVKGWVLSVSDGIGATPGEWPGERSSSELFLGFLQSLPEEPSTFDVSAWCWLTFLHPAYFTQ